MSGRRMRRQCIIGVSIMKFILWFPGRHFARLPKFLYSYCVVKVYGNNFRTLFDHNWTKCVPFILLVFSSFTYLSFFFFFLFCECSVEICFICIGKRVTFTSFARISPKWLIGTFGKIAYLGQDVITLANFHTNKSILSSAIVKLGASPTNGTLFNTKRAHLFLSASNDPSYRKFYETSTLSLASTYIAEHKITDGVEPVKCKISSSEISIIRIIVTRAFLAVILSLSLKRLNCEISRTNLRARQRDLSHKWDF